MTAELVLTGLQEDIARDLHAAGFVKMRPLDFLELTAVPEGHTPTVTDLLREAAPLEAYNQVALAGRIGPPPFLRIDVTTGRITGHEGRHRAAALYREDADAIMDVAVLLRDKASVPVGLDRLPRIVHGQFRPEIRVAFPRRKFRES